jgi:ATP-dependent DNA helicase Rep
MEAVHHLDGPCLVLAGAGSGKTRVITYKIVRLLQSGLAPKEIAAITFTNKASQEMRERAKQLVGGRAAKDLAISTFHSLGVRMLREDGAKLGLKEQFSILDSDDVMGVLKEAGGASDNKLARQWQWTISLWKNMGLNSEAAAHAAKDADEQVAARVMKLYEERLQAYQAVDFDDLISFPLNATRTPARNGRSCSATCSSTSTRTPTPCSTSCSSNWWATRRPRASRPWVTTTRASTAGAARPSTT